jgi:hypothetical protein
LFCATQPRPFSTSFSFSNSISFCGAQRRPFSFCLPGALRAAGVAAADQAAEEEAYFLGSAAEGSEFGRCDVAFGR